MCEFLEYEYTRYRKYMFPTRFAYFRGKITKEPIIDIMKWQRSSRIADYHYYTYRTKKNKWSYILYQWHTRKKNKIGNRIGLDISTTKIGKGLMIYHGNNVINYWTEIGENCELHGNCIIGNKGRGEGELHILGCCPVIGNNVEIGAGAIVIGEIKIANDVTIGANAVVVHSIKEPDCTIAGIPARKIKELNE